MPEHKDSLFDFCAGFLKEYEFEFKTDNDNGLYIVEINDCGVTDGILMVRENDRQVLFYSLWPDIIKPEYSFEIMRYITSVNFGIVMGNFEFNTKDNLVRFKTSVDVEYTEISYGILSNLIESNLAMMDQYGAGLLAVNSGDDVMKILEDCD
jgi:hypothetical protein